VKKNVPILLIILCILAVSTLILFAEEAKYDFRKTNWGMSKEQVKATEDKKPDFEDNTMLSYEVTISEKDFECAYLFLEDKLYGSGYLFFGEHTNKNLYIDDYEELKEILTKEYGKPKIDKVTWKNDLLKNLESSNELISELKENIKEKEKQIEKLRANLTKEKKDLEQEYTDKLSILAEKKAKLDASLAEKEKIWLDKDKEKEQFIITLEEEVKEYKKNISRLYNEIANLKVQLTKEKKDLEKEYADKLSELREEKIKLGTLLAEKEAEYANRLSLLDEQSRGLAISIGDLAYGASWETSTTKIDLMLSGDNYKIKLILSYISKELEEWVKQTKEKEASKDF
jgi:DNA repair exonuclease SbcCD ATPase subunit